MLAFSTGQHLCLQSASGESTLYISQILQMSLNVVYIWVRFKGINVHCFFFGKVFFTFLRFNIVIIFFQLSVILCSNLTPVSALYVSKFKSIGMYKVYIVIDTLYMSKYVMSLQK